MLAINRLSRTRVGLMAVSVLASTLAFGNAVAKTATAPASITAAPVVTVIQGTPLEVHVGDDLSFQVFNSNVPGSGQIFPSDATGTADMGWFVRASDVLYSPNFGEHSSGTATGGLGAYTAFTPGTLSGVSGNGSAAAPFQVSTSATLGASGLAATQVVSYVNGNNYFTKTLTVSNGGAAQPVSIFLGADIFLAASDSGVPFLQAASTSPGGQTCAGIDPQYTILLIPQTSPDAYSAQGYSQIWSEIGSGTLDNAVSTSTCIDNGAALQWNRTIAAGASVTIQAAVSFGEIPPIAQFNVTAVTPNSGAAGSVVNVTISGIGFQADTVFDFGADIVISNLVIVDGNTATATLTIAPAAVAGPRDVTGEQTDGGLVAVLPNGFTVTGGTPPTFAVTAVSPPRGNVGSQVAVTISGSGFQTGTTFDFGAGVSVSNIAIVNGNSATATLTIAGSATPGSRDVNATQSPGGATATLANGFTVIGGGGPPPGSTTPVPALGWPGLLALMLAFTTIVLLRVRTQRKP